MDMFIVKNNHTAYVTC